MAVSGLKKEQRKYIALLLTPAILTILVFTTVPAVTTLSYAFFKWEGFQRGGFAGFENSLAVMEDPETGSTFSLHVTTYNNARTKGSNLREWSSLSVNDIIHCEVFKYYITREGKRDRVRGVMAG